jgi:hypothetical protein
MGKRVIAILLTPRRVDSHAGMRPDGLAATVASRLRERSGRSNRSSMAVAACSVVNSRLSRPRGDARSGTVSIVTIGKRCASARVRCPGLGCSKNDTGGYARWILAACILVGMVPGPSAATYRTPPRFTSLPKNRCPSDRANAKSIPKNVLPAWLSPASSSMPPSVIRSSTRHVGNTSSRSPSQTSVSSRGSRAAATGARLLRHLCPACQHIFQPVAVLIKLVPTLLIGAS